MSSKFQELFGNEMSQENLKEKTCIQQPKNDWVQEGDILYPCNGKVSVTDNIIPGIYRVVPSPNPMDNRVGIRYVGEKFDLGVEKLYRTGGEEVQEAIKKTWESKIFRDRKSNLCSIFSGIKGTGKTITAKQLCNHYASRYPIFIIDNHFGGNIVGFTQSLDFTCVLLIDEAEKTFCENQRVSLLKICDGALNQTPKIVLMTMNDLNVDPNILSRPGRVRYIQGFENLPESTCREILKDNLIDKSFVEPIYEVLASLKNVTIDVVKSITEEVNIYGDLKTVKKFMNLDKADISTSIVVIPDVDESEVQTVINIGFLADRYSYGVTSIPSLHFDYVEGAKKKKKSKDDFDDDIAYGSMRKDFMMPKEIYKFLNKRDCDSTGDLRRKDYITCFSTYEVGMLKFDVGTYIPNFGIIEKCYGNDWYKVKLDFTGEGSKQKEFDPEYNDYDDSELIGNISRLRKLNNKLIDQGDYVMAYIYSRPPFSAYSSTKINVNAF